MRRFFLLLFALALAARLCHLDILWAEETLPLAAAAQLVRGKILYRDVWFDKPPLLAWTCLLWAARDGWPLRLASALYVLLAALAAWLFARDLWGRREAFLAASLTAFCLIFYLPAAVTPLSADVLMIAPHIAAVWLAWRRRPLWSGVVAGVAFLVNVKGIVVLAACAIWDIRAVPLLLAGFAIPNAIAAAWLWTHGALADYFDQVWKWGRIYAGATFVRRPLLDGLLRTGHWLGFHAALVIAAVYFWLRGFDDGCDTRDRLRWTAWAALSFIAVCLGWRFFPRYYFQLLPVAALAAARGFTLLDRRRAFAVAALLLIPLVRFGPRYAMLAADLLAGRPHQWVDVAMDQDSRHAARLVRASGGAGQTLFVWGFRPEIYIYTGLPAATRYLDSQPLTGVPADRHLFDWQPVESKFTSARRAGLVGAQPTFIMDGLGPMNPHLAITAFEDLRPWLAQYHPAGATPLTTIYRKRPIQ